MSDKKKGMLMLIIDLVLLGVLGFLFGWFIADGNVKMILIASGIILGILIIYFVSTARLRHKYIFKSGLLDIRAGEKM